MKQMATIWEQRIGRCANFDEIRSLRDLIQPELHERLPFSNLEEWVGAANRIHDALITRTVSIAEQSLKRELGQRPPTPYAFVLFGSGGRSEQTLWSDQDNGIIYRHQVEGSPVYFERLAVRIEEGLKVVGYPPCEGNVVAGNDQWRKSLHGWQEMISDWFEDASWENVRQLLIVADARAIYGDPSLVDELKRTYNERVRTTEGILAGMLKNTLRHKVVLGPLGNLIREPYGEDAGGFDIKYGAYIPMVNAVRLLSIKHQIRETSTLERLHKLSAYVGMENAIRWKNAFLMIVKLRSMTPFQISEEGYFMTRGKLGAQQLTKEITNKLKDCIHVGEQMQKYIKKDGLT